jgi:hypothetical protein
MRKRAGRQREAAGQFCWLVLAGRLIPFAPRNKECNMTRKRKLVKAPTGPKEQNAKEGFSNEKSPINGNPNLKKLVAPFKKAHQAFCDNLLQTTYRLIHDARKIGDLLLKMQKESGFKSKRQLHIWLELEAKVSIPQPTFYRYIQAAEDFQQVEIIHGTKMLTEITSNKVLKMFANPKVPLEPQVDGWDHKDGVFTKGDWTIRNHNGTTHLWEADHCNGEKGFIMSGLKDIVKAVQARIDASTNPNSKSATAATQHVSHPSNAQAQDAVIEGGDDSDPNDEADEEQKPQEAAQEPTTKPIYLFNHCHNFQLCGETLKATDQQGATVILMAPKGQRITDLLKDALGENTQAHPTKRRAAK